jgi:hypothetical protein
MTFETCLDPSFEVASVTLKFLSIFVRQILKEFSNIKFIQHLCKRV